MSIDARETLSKAADDLASTRGVVLYVVFLLFALVSLPVHQTLTQEMTRWFVEVAEVPPDQIAIPTTPLALDVDPIVLAGALAAIFVVAELLRVLAIRSFASTASDAIPMDEITAGGFRTLLVLLAASLLVQVLVYGGLVLFVIPGLIFAVLTLFVRQAVLLGDAGVVGSIKESFRIVVDETVPVILLLAAVFVLSFVVGLPTTLLNPELVVTPIASVLFGTVVTVYGVAVFTRAYQQAGSEDAADGEGSTVGDALGPDDLDDGTFDGDGGTTDTADA